MDRLMGTSTKSRILSGLRSHLKQVGFAILFLGGIAFAGPMTVNAPGNSYFVANEGQWEGDFSFKCEVGSTVYYITPKGMTVNFREFRRYPKPRDPRDPLDMMERHEDRDSVTVRGHVVQIHYVTPPTPPAEARGDQKLVHYSNYFLGRDSTKWRSRVGHYERIIVAEVWPGIDVEYRADKLGVETVYHVKPGADPSQIQMEYLGLDAPLRIDSQGNLVLATSLGDVKEKAPLAFQQEARMQKRVESGYRIVGENLVGFDVGLFDHGKELVVDPLIYSTYFGGDGGLTNINQLAVLPSGEKLLCGRTNSEEFPATTGAYQTSLMGRQNGFVTKLSVDARSILISTFFGDDYVLAMDLEVLPNSTIVIAGYVSNLGGQVPLTPNALDTIRGEDYEGYIARFDSSLSNLLYCSYLGGNGSDFCTRVDQDSVGRIIVSGRTASADFAITPDALFPELIGGSNVFISIFDPDPPSLIYSTFFGNTSCDEAIVRVADDGSLWIAGTAWGTGLAVTPDAYQSEHGSPNFLADMFLSHMRLSPPANLYTTYFGGSHTDIATSLEILEGGNIALFGYSSSDTWPTTPGAFDSTTSVFGHTSGFVTILLPPDSIIFSTLLGGDNGTSIDAACLSPDSGFFIGGITRDPDFPVTSNAFDSIYGPNIGDSWSDLFISKFSSDLRRLEYSTFFGGEFRDRLKILWPESNTRIWVFGNTESSQDFPVTPDAIRLEMEFFGNDGFISCIGIDPLNTAPSHAVPSSFTLSAFPNPFNQSISIVIETPSKVVAGITIHNSCGQEVTSIPRSVLTPGTNFLRVDVREWASGTYFLSVNSQLERRTIRVQLLR